MATYTDTTRWDPTKKYGVAVQPAKAAVPKKPGALPGDVNWGQAAEYGWTGSGDRSVVTQATQGPMTAPNIQGGDYGGAGGMDFGGAIAPYSGPSADLLQSQSTEDLGILSSGMSTEDPPGAGRSRADRPDAGGRGCRQVHRRPHLGGGEDEQVLALREARRSGAQGDRAVARRAGRARDALLGAADEDGAGHPQAGRGAALRRRAPVLRLGRRAALRLRDTPARVGAADRRGALPGGAVPRRPRVAPVGRSTTAPVSRGARASGPTCRCRRVGTRTATRTPATT